MRYALLFAAFLIACGEGTVEAPELLVPEPPDLLEKVVRGEVTTERPEVGTLSVGCTGTLVAPNVVISAAHCFSYGTRANRGNYGSFTIEADGQEHRYSIERYKSFSNRLGSADINVVGLGESVPANVATPAPIAQVTPADGTDLTVYGYGCTSRGRGTDWVKRKATFAEGQDTNHLCPGDSGGPVFDDSTGAVLRINSGYWQDGFGTDIFGHVPTHYDSVRAQIEEWADGALPEIGGAPDGSPDVPITIDDLVTENPDGTPIICGLDQPLQRFWACNEGGNFRWRCAKGRQPVGETCELGCRAGRADTNAVCTGQEAPPAPQRECGEYYEPYTTWTCSTDNIQMVLCSGGMLNVWRCQNGCEATGAGVADVCL